MFQKYKHTKRGTKNETAQHRQKLLFRKNRLRSFRSRRVRRTGKHLEISVSCGKIRRRNFSCYLYPSCCDLRIYHDNSRNLIGQDDAKKPCRGVFFIRQVQMACGRRLDKRSHSHSHSAVLFGNRRLGNKISYRIHNGANAKFSRGRIFLRIYFGRRFYRNLLCFVLTYCFGDYFCGRAQGH